MILGGVYVRCLLCDGVGIMPAVAAVGGDWRLSAHVEVLMLPAACPVCGGTGRFTPLPFEADILGEA